MCRPAIVVVIVVAVLCLIAAWGILESVVIASVFTLIEVGGLVAIVVAAVGADVPAAAVMLKLPAADFATLSGHRVREPAGVLRLHRV